MSNKSANKCDVSVVIRVRNEEQWIGYAIQSLLDFLLKPEIVIVDNKSTDDTEYILKQLHDKNIEIKYYCNIVLTSSTTSKIFTKLS